MPATRPDNIFLIGALYKLLLGKRFLFDHHDINPELYEAKFGRRDLFYRLVRLAERLTFLVADVSIATNESYRRIAIERGRMRPQTGVRGALRTEPRAPAHPAAGAAPEARAAVPRRLRRA